MALTVIKNVCIHTLIGKADKNLDGYPIASEKGFPKVQSNCNLHTRNQHG